MRGGWLAAWVLTLALAFIGVSGSSPVAGACTTPAQSPVHGYDAPAVARLTVHDAAPAGFVEGQLTAPLERSATRAGLARGSSTTLCLGGVATNSLATATDEAVFWSGIRGGDSAAASWAAKNGGATLESTLAERGKRYLRGTRATRPLSLRGGTPRPTSRRALGERCASSRKTPSVSTAFGRKSISWP